MKAYSGYKAEAPVRRVNLPAGGYLAKILDAQEVTYEWGSVLLISFDIVDGKFKSFFERDYRNQPQERQKWRGTFRLRIPNDDGSEKDEWSKTSFNNAMWAIENSNHGFRWNWDETALKGKCVGVLYRNREWEIDGKRGWTTECCAFTTIKEVQENSFQTPKDKPLSKRTANASPDIFTDSTDNYGASAPQGGLEEASLDSSDLPF